MVNLLPSHIHWENNEGEDLTAEQCYFNYDHEYHIAKTAGELLK